MGRPRCDPFDAAAIIAAVGKGETTPFRAYQDYAATAAHTRGRRLRFICEDTNGLTLEEPPGRPLVARARRPARRLSAAAPGPTIDP
jgi:hypothetical protein